MSNLFRTRNLCQAAFGVRPEATAKSEARAKLRQSFFQLRDAAATMAREIGRDMPTMTVHDVTHADALWELASVIAGPAYDLTPTEVFILGSAFLIHDLAMSRAAYGDGIDRLPADPRFKDRLFGLLRVRLGPSPSEQKLEDAPHDLRDGVSRELLRLDHARQAELLLTRTWSGPDGQNYYLLQDYTIREAYSNVIGRISHSHSWPAERLRKAFEVQLGAPAGMPGEWHVDPLTVAALPQWRLSGLQFRPWPRIGRLTLVRYWE